jgi:hypothetical protein
MGPPLKGGPIQERPDVLKPFCLEDPLSESAFAWGPSFVGAPLFVGALCSCTSCTCLNPALARCVFFIGHAHFLSFDVASCQFM